MAALLPSLSSPRPYHVGRRTPLLGAVFAVFASAAPLRAQSPPAAEPASPEAPAPPPEASLPAPPPPSGEAAPATPAPASLEPTPLDNRPVIDVSVPEPPPSRQRSYHFHDGFYLRANAGLLLGRASISTDSTTHSNHTVAGGGIALDLLIGGTPSPGLALGGALMLHGFSDRHVESATGSGTGSLTLLGVFVDGFPRPNKGLHFGGLIGLAASNTTRQDNRDEFEGGGLGMAAWIGHDFWVGDEWSLGGLLRFNGALLRDSSEEDAADPVTLANTSFGLGLAFTALYH